MEVLKVLTVVVKGSRVEAQESWSLYVQKSGVKL
jgi:hypothetical protein